MKTVFCSMSWTGVVKGLLEEGGSIGVVADAGLALMDGVLVEYMSFVTHSDGGFLAIRNPSRKYSMSEWHRNGDVTLYRASSREDYDYIMIRSSETAELVKPTLTLRLMPWRVNPLHRA